MEEGEDKVEAEAKLEAYKKKSKKAIEDLEKDKGKLTNKKADAIKEKTKLQNPVKEVSRKKELIKKLELEIGEHNKEIDQLQTEYKTQNNLFKKLDDQISEAEIVIKTGVSLGEFVIQQLRDVCYSAYLEDSESLYTSQLNQLSDSIEDVFEPLSLFFNAEQKNLAIQVATAQVLAIE